MVNDSLRKGIDKLKSLRVNYCRKSKRQTVVQICCTI